MDYSQFKQDVYDIVRQIPPGRVLAYGDIAKLAGYPNHSRHVGHVLATAPPSLHLPCHRIVSASGCLVPTWQQQADILGKEGVEVRKTKKWAKVNMRRYRWNIMSENL